MNASVYLAFFRPSSALRSGRSLTISFISSCAFLARFCSEIYPFDVTGMSALPSIATK